MQWKREYAGVAVAGLVLGTGAIGLWVQKGGGASASPPAQNAPLDFEIPAGGPDPTPTATIAEAATTNAAPSPVPAVSAAPVVIAPVKYKAFVSGAVKVPGVYSFAPGSRIDDAIRAAGGFKPNADTTTINLADFLRDADHITVPVKSSTTAPVLRVRPAIVRGGSSPVSAVAARPVFRPKAGTPSPTTAPFHPRPVLVPETMPEPFVPTPEPTPGRVIGKSVADAEQTASGALASEGKTAPVLTAKSTGKSGGASGAKFKNPGDGVVNLNTASAAELEKLPGVGPSTALKILEYRQEIGKFTDISQMQDVKGIGPKKFAKMMPFLVVR